MKFLPYVLKSLFRKKTRSVLTILSIVLPGYEAERAFGHTTVYRARRREPAASPPPGAQKTSWSEKR